MSKIVESLRYSKDHEWVRLEGDRAFVGITDYAQSELGEVVYVELPPVGERYEQGEEISTVESVKAASPIINPIEGVVESVNEALEGSPELLNEDSYANHLYVLTGFESSQYDGLLSAAEYEAFIATL